MKLQHTATVTEEITIERTGRTVGEMINDMLRDAMQGPDARITNVSVSLTDEDWIAMRLLQSPVQSKPAFKPNRD